MQDVTRSRIQQLVKTDCITLNRKTITDCSHRVKHGDEIEVTLPPPEPSELMAKPLPLDILFEDDAMLVINKQAGMTVHPGAGNHQDTLVNALLSHCEGNLSGIGGVSRPGIVHRLDKETSGLMVVAKTDKAHQSLSHQISKRILKRVYYAIVWGVPVPRQGKIEANIARSTKNRKKMAIFKTGGREAITHYEVIESLHDGIASLVECRLETGRTHQIRVHMTHKGHSLLGDPSYGSANTKTLRSLEPDVRECITNFTRQALHSHHIGFFHPVTEEWMEFDAPMPEDMRGLYEGLK